MNINPGLIAISIGCLSLPLPAVATLGGNALSAQTDQVQMKASMRIKSADKFQIHELQMPSGTVVREYLDASGTVFAVAWQGPWKPDLQQLLGEYFGPFVQGAQEKHGGHGYVLVQQPGLVVQSHGRMRSYAGKAFLPNQLPAGVTAGDIQ